MIGEQAENKLFDLTHPSYQRDRGCVGTLTDELQEKVNELAAQQRKRALDSGGLHTLVEKYNCPTTAYAASKSKAPKNISNAKTKGANTLSTAQHKDGESTHGNVTPTTEVTSQPQQPPFLPTQPSLQVQAALPNTSPDTNNNTADALLNGSSPSGLPLAGHSAQTTNVGGGLSHPTPPPTSPTVQLNSTAEPQTPTPHSRKRRRLDPFSNEDPSSSPPAQPALFVTPTHRNHARVIASDIPIAEDSRTKAKRLYGQLLGLYTTVVPTWRKTTFPKLYEIERVLEAINKTWRHPSTATPLEFCGHHSKWGRALTEKIDIAIRNGEISIVDHMSAVPQ